MKTNGKTQSGLKVTTNVKASGLPTLGSNHNRRALAVKTNIKAGQGVICANHSRRLVTNRKIQSGLKVTTNVKASGLPTLGSNHNRRALAVKTNIKAGQGVICANHSRRLATNGKTQSGLKVTTNVKASGLPTLGSNHNRHALAVKTNIKAGQGVICANHSRRLA